MIFSCNERFSPKPNGYLRIDLEKKIDTIFNPIECPFYFNAPQYWAIQKKTMQNNNCWIDLNYIKHRATIHLTYKRTNTNVFELLEESRAMVYKHTVKADEITEKKYTNNLNKTYGTLYDIYGETASSVQFHITDSNSNFLRGALVRSFEDKNRP